MRMNLTNLKQLRLTLINDDRKYIMHISKRVWPPKTLINISSLTGALSEEQPWEQLALRPTVKLAIANKQTS